MPASIRGYGHVKLASLAIARARESELLHRFDPERYPRPTGPAVAGQFRGIPVTRADAAIAQRGARAAVSRAPAGTCRAWRQRVGA